MIWDICRWRRAFGESVILCKLMKFSEIYKRGKINGKSRIMEKNIIFVTVGMKYRLGTMLMR